MDTYQATHETLKALRALAATSSSKGKLDLLKTYTDPDKTPFANFFKDVLLYAYHPQKSFNITYAPSGIGNATLLGYHESMGDEETFVNKILEENGLFGADVFDLLDALQKRTISGDKGKAIAGWLLNEQFFDSPEMAAGVKTETAHLFELIVNKNLECGINSSTINKACKGLIPEYPYMRCSGVSNLSGKSAQDWLKAGNTVISQEKMDGMFVNLNVENGGISLMSRNGSPYPEQHPAFEQLRTAADKLDEGYQYHGEFLITDKAGNILPREQGNGIFNSILKNPNFVKQDGGLFGESFVPDGSFDPKKHQVLFVVWDKIPLALTLEDKPEKSPLNQDYILRLESLSGQIESLGNPAIRLVETMTFDSLQKAQEHFESVLQRGGEGIICKLAHAKWKDGTSAQQIKLKVDFSVDLEICGFMEGNGKYKGNLGSVECRTSDGLLKVSVSGFNDKERMEIWQNRDSYMGKIMEVQANCILSSRSNDTKSLFLPRFVEIRTDKSQADSLERVEQQFADSINVQGQIAALENKVKTTAKKTMKPY